MTEAKSLSRLRLAGALALAQVLVFAHPAGAEEGKAAEKRVAEAAKQREQKPENQAAEAAPGYDPAPESAPPFNGSKGFDAVAVRPTTFFTSLISAGAFVIGLPFAALDPAIGVGRAKENLVEYPFNDTFERPLGDLDAMGRPPARVEKP